ncbi:neuronal acetylcholine receptor subunit alpha-7-like [Zeugodacus cucurbitae]|uniref:neuronal acetylcholine receptor subunit alpha-7-like n=1 Tax=Zeugodacus cucurbitae TaxID=28588 RepID=UPI0023D93F08|nr:neuronal acetylcholine receptor subunit alpha-7-like [Zeugodacus cucurbitae]
MRTTEQQQLRKLIQTHRDAWKRYINTTRTSHEMPNGTQSLKASAFHPFSNFCVSDSSSCCVAPHYTTTFPLGRRSLICTAAPHEKRLLHALLDNYNSLERPVVNESDPLHLSFGLTLMQIIDVDEKNQLLITNIWLKLEWNDMNLRWNSSEYGGVRDLRIPPHRLWKPDVLMYNSADEGFDGTYATNVVVRNNGSCLYVPPGIFKSTCKIDITWFPFDYQRCEMKFGSWTYDGFQPDNRAEQSLLEANYFSDQLLFT